MTSSVDRVRNALVAAGHPDTIGMFPEGTKTASDAAAAIGCTVSQIAKSILFRSGDQSILIITSGSNRVNIEKISAILNLPIDRADADWVRNVTGFVIGGVSPIAHLSPPHVLIDQDLLALDPIWAAAGSPTHTFRTTINDLIQMTGGKIADIKAV